METLLQGEDSRYFIGGRTILVRELDQAHADPIRTNRDCTTSVFVLEKMLIKPMHSSATSNALFALKDRRPLRGGVLLHLFEDPGVFE